MRSRVNAAFSGSPQVNDYGFVAGGSWKLNWALWQMRNEEEKCVRYVGCQLAARAVAD